MIKEANAPIALPLNTAFKLYSYIILIILVYSLTYDKLFLITFDICSFVILHYTLTQNY